MPLTVTAKDKTFTFPDGTSNEDIGLVIDEHFGSLPTEKTPETPITQTFDPEGSGYDQVRADELGYKRSDDPSGKGHLPSLDDQTGMVLKGRANIDEWDLMAEEEDRLGNEIVKKDDGRYYSVPKDNTFADDKRNYAKDFMEGKITEDEYRAGYEYITGKEALVHDTPTHKEYIEKKKSTKQPVVLGETWKSATSSTRLIDIALDTPIIENINKVIGITKKPETPFVAGFSQYVHENWDRISDESKKYQDARQLITTDLYKSPGIEVPTWGDPGLDYMRQLAVDLDVNGVNEDWGSSFEYMTKWDEYADIGIPPERWDEYQQDSQAHQGIVENQELVMKDFMGQLSKWAERDKLAQDQIDKFKEQEIDMLMKAQ